MSRLESCIERVPLGGRATDSPGADPAGKRRTHFFLPWCEACERSHDHDEVDSACCKVGGGDGQDGGCLP